MPVLVPLSLLLQNSYQPSVLSWSFSLTQERLGCGFNPSLQPPGLGESARSCLGCACPYSFDPCAGLEREGLDLEACGPLVRTEQVTPEMK